MNVILVAATEVVAGKVLLSDHRAEHIIKVLKSRTGDRIKVGIINGKLGYGNIVGMGKKFPFWVELDVVFDRIPLEKPPVDLLLALPRPIMLRRIFSQVAALGIGTIHIIQANRVEKSFWDASLLRREEYEPHLIHGLEQAVDTILPEVCFHSRFNPFIEDFFPNISSSYTNFIFAHPQCKQALHTLFTSQLDRVLFAVGPEGGWVDYEISKFQQAGFVGFSLGERILKVDTAVINIHGRIMANIERTLRD